MPQQMQPPVQRNDVDYKTGYYQHESQLTQQKLDQQETATQRLIRIQQEKDQIKTMYQKMLAENKRLKEQLGEKEQLLKQVETVIEKARQQIKTANVENEELRRQVTKLESDNESQRLASSRQLDAIRKKLDDVLMREISDN